jgi:hypothetical protein
LCTLFDVNYQPKNMSPDELRAGLYWLAEKLYNEPAVQARQRDFMQRVFDSRASFFVASAAEQPGTKTSSQTSIG